MDRLVQLPGALITQPVKLAPRIDAPKAGGTTMGADSAAMDEEYLDEMGESSGGQAALGWLVGRGREVRGAFPAPLGRGPWRLLLNTPSTKETCGRRQRTSTVDAAA
ncbi:hypothetical protein GZL_01297 [Streptomyces sp. 769]|nr:hypothetical protein GZL_01297 [Streptomyces sp. 769]